MGQSWADCGPWQVLLLSGMMTAAATLASTSQVRLPHLIEIVPGEGAVLDRVDTVVVVLDLTRGQPVDLNSLRLALDGQDLTTKCTTVMTRDVPPSRVEARCPVPLNLKEGQHRIELQLEPVDEPPLVYAWHFVLRPGPKDSL